MNVKPWFTLYHSFVYPYLNYAAEIYAETIWIGAIRK